MFEHRLSPHRYHGTVVSSRWATTRGLPMVRVCIVCDAIETIPNTEHREGVRYVVCSEECLANQKRGNEEKYDPEKYHYHPCKRLPRKTGARGTCPPVDHLSRE